MNWTEQDLRDEFRAQQDSAPSALAVLARLDIATRHRRRTRVTWTAVLAVVAVTAGISVLATGRPARPTGAPPNPVYSHDPAYGMSTALPPTSCTVSVLPMPAGDHVGSATAIDPSGRYILLQSAESQVASTFATGGWPSVDAGSTIHTSLLVDGELRPLDVPGSAADVNASGVVVGSDGTGPWILRDGHMSKLPGVGMGYAFGINSTGAVAGIRLLGQSSVPMYRPVVWRAPGAKAVDLPVPQDTTGDASDVDDDGTVVGSYTMGGPGQTSGAPGHASHAIVWFPDGTHRELLPPPGSGLINPYAVSIRNGWVAGGADTPAVGSEKPPMLVGLLWNLRTGGVRVLPPVAGARVNRHGWVVGINPHTVLVTDAGTLQLPDLGGSHTSPSLVGGISDDGRVIVGQSNSKPVLWRCD